MAWTFGSSTTGVSALSQSSDLQECFDGWGRPWCAIPGSPLSIFEAVSTKVPSTRDLSGIPPEKQHYRNVPIGAHS
jgi:hypothetical protein